MLPYCLNYLYSFLAVPSLSSFFPATLEPSTMAALPPSPIIPIVALGVYRHVAATMDPLFNNSPFRMTAIMDLAQNPASVRYTPENMATVLYNLHPRPKVFITGAAISRQMTEESIAVWSSYVQDSKEKDTFLINVCRSSTLEAV
ncbi:MAG: hypothetical protein Q9170_007248 [Blastenia crenularia]